MLLLNKIRKMFFKQNFGCKFINDIDIENKLNLNISESFVIIMLPQNAMLLIVKFSII